MRTWTSSLRSSRSSMALRSLMARTTTTNTLWRAPSSAGPAVVRAVPRMSPASSSRRYTSQTQDDYEKNLELYKEVELLLTRIFNNVRENAKREARSEKIWSLGPVGIALGLCASTAVGHFVGFACGYHFGVDDAIISLELAEKKSDESTDDA